MPRLVPQSPDRDRTRNLLENVNVSFAKQILNQWRLEANGKTILSHLYEVPASAYIGGNNSKEAFDTKPPQLNLVMHIDYAEETFPVELSKAIGNLFDVPEKYHEYLTMVLSPHSRESRLRNVLDRAGINGRANTAESKAMEPATTQPEPAKKQRQTSKEEEWKSKGSEGQPEIIEVDCAGPQAIEDLVYGKSAEPENILWKQQIGRVVVPLVSQGTEHTRKANAIKLGWGPIASLGSRIGSACLNAFSSTDPMEQLMGEHYVGSATAVSYHRR